MRPTLTENRKFRRLAALIGDDALAVGSLELIWATCYASGDEIIGDSVDVEAAARWRGEPGKLTGALLAAGGGGSTGFIEMAPDRPASYRVHDLWDHAPDYVRRRRERELQRHAKGQEMAATDRSLTSHRPAIDRSMVGTPSPSPAPAPAQQLSAADSAASPRQKRRGRAAAQPADSDLAYFGQHHEKIIGTEYLAAFARDNKLLTEARKLYGRSRLREMIAAFFEEQRREITGHNSDGRGEPRSWIGKAKPNVPGFYGQIPTLVKEWEWDTEAAKESP